jgi:hypothetical protein
MKMTVGPLPPAVYWRRRAVVIGALIAAVLVLTYSCVSSGQSAGKPRAAAPTTAASPTTQPSPTGEPLLTPGVGTPPPDGATPPPAGTPAPTAAAPVDPGAAGSGPCADTELQITPMPETTSVKQGVPVRITLRIKNVAARPCPRDVGASAQELYLVQGGTKAWSSDACDAPTGTSVRTYQPGDVTDFFVVWNAKQTAGGCGGTRPWAAVGAYQLFARVGTKVSDPVAFQVTA